MGEQSLSKSLMASEIPPLGEVTKKMFFFLLMVDDSPPPPLSMKIGLPSGRKDSADEQESFQARAAWSEDDYRTGEVIFWLQHAASW